MPLFSQLPPGVQIKRWFTILTILVILIDLIAAASLVVMNNYVHAITGHYEPLLSCSGDIACSVFRMETSSYRYLYGLDGDTSRLLADLRGLRAEIGELARVGASASLGSDLEAIGGVLTQYEHAVGALAKAGVDGREKRLESLKKDAAALSKMAEELASRIRAQANEQIAENSHRYRRIAQTAQYIFVAFLAISLLMVVLLLLWWREFEEMILQL